MHKKRVSPSPACVPFAWEESPGVPKNVLQEIVSRPHPAIVSFPLCKPPCLQIYDIQGPLAKTPSFNSIHPAPRYASKRLLRRSSFDTIIFSRSKSGHADSFFSSLNYNADGSIPALGVRMEDDPFLMALQVCRKASVRVCEEAQRGGAAGRNRFSLYRDPGRIRVCDEEKAKQRSGSVAGKQFSHHRDTGRNRVSEEEKASGWAAYVEEGFFKQPPPTTGQLLFTQHLQQDGHMRTITVQKKRANGFITFFASCFGCHYLTSN